MDLSEHAAPDISHGRVVPPEELLEEDDTWVDFGPSVEACVWSLAILAAGWLALRLYLKIRKHRGLWWDDHFLIISWVCIVLSNVCTTIAISFGWLRDPADVDLQNWPRILLVLIIAGAFSIMGAAVSKTSFALTLLRISAGGWVRFVVWFAMLTVNVVMGLSIVFNWVSCSPVEKAFNVFVPGTCWPKATLIGYNTFVAAYSGIMDILLALLPWKIIWKMNMSRRERFGAICAMSLGFLAGTISFAKILAVTGTIQASLSSSIQLTVLSIAETSATIMASSIPILRALARDKAGPRGIKLFTLNATEHMTVQRDSMTMTDPDSSSSKYSDDDPENNSINNKPGDTSKRLFKIVRKATAWRAPVLSNIIEDDDELSPRMSGMVETRERSFV
ncbi:hypothetical protein F4808DRAFT_431119 [Astrocystis sublimbata]|nr:hypothetical protein F4808DRAFT_431119 [Astrocystis sublimbata]